jgi:hypothetical protein
MIQLLSPVSLKLVLLFSLVNLSLAAQERDFLRNILKESLKTDFILDPMTSKLDTFSYKRLIILDVNKEPLPIVTFNRQLDSLFFNYKYVSSSDKNQTISPYATMFYTNQQNYDRNATETTGDIVGNVVLFPLASIIMLNPFALADYLMRVGILPDEPFVPKTSKKQQTLKTINHDVYHIDDDY